MAALGKLFGRRLRASRPGDPGVFRCSSNQLRYIRASLVGQQSYFLPISFDLPRAVPVDRVIEAVRTVIADDPSLDVRIASAADTDFLLVHAMGEGLSVRIVDLDDAAAAAADAEAFVHDGKPLLGAPLIRLHVAKRLDGGALLTLALHHVIADAISLQLFLDRLALAYAGAAEPKESTPSFAEIVEPAALRPGDWPAEQESFWTAALADCAEDIATLPLYDLEAGRRSAGRRDERHLMLPAAAFAQVKAAAAAMGVTPFRLTAAAYLLLLARHTGAPGAAIVIQSAGRRGLAGVADVIGQFSTALPVFARPDGETPLRDFIGEVSHRISAAIAHERVPFDRMIALTGAHPVFGINWYPQVETLRLGGAIYERVPLVEWQSDFHLNLHCVTQAGGLKLSVSYPSGTIDADRADLFLESLRDLMLAASTCPAERLGRIALRGPVPATPIPAPPGNDLVEAFRARAGDGGDLPALVDGEAIVSYADLASEVDRVRDALVAGGVGPGTRIALHVDRHASLVPLLLAACDLRAVFALFDRNYPAERLAQMARVFAPEVTVIPGGGDGQPVSALGQEYRLERPIHAVEPPLLPREARYAQFTSGSTGAPKCVVSDDAGLRRFIHWHVERHGFGPGTRFALTGGLGHDPVLRDIFTPLVCGGTLHVPPAAHREDPRVFFRWLDASGIEVLHATPQLTRLLLMGRDDSATLDRMRWVFWGGDMLDRAHADDMLAACPIARGGSIYGTTETPQAAGLLHFDRTADWRFCPIATAAPQRRVILEAPDGRAAGYGELADIVVEGEGLALGYFDATRADGWQPFDTQGRYRTGDRGFHLPDGLIGFAGRADGQIKVRGYRVEPAEIVRLLESAAEVEQALVLPQPGAGGETDLVAYVVATADGSPDLARTLRKRCQQALPAPLVPREVMVVPAIPLTQNGKVDKARLPTTAGTGDAGGGLVRAPATDAERALHDELTILLRRDAISMDSQVIDLGLDSLSYLSLMLALERRVGDLPPGWEEMPLHELARVSGGRSAYTSIETPVLTRALSIMAVVGLHYKFLPGLGATAALFFISGHSFGRFVAPAMVRQASLLPLARLWLMIAIPTLGYTLLLEAATGNLHPASFVLATNLVGPNTAHRMYFWFVELLLQNLLLLGLPFLLASFRRFLAKDWFRGALVVVALALVARFLVPLVWDPDHLVGRVPHMTLWLLTLGWALAAAHTIAQRLLVGAISAASTAATFLTDTPVTIFTIVIVAIIMAVDRIRIPRVIASALSLVAAGSLFIYLTNIQVARVFGKLLDEYAVYVLPVQFAVALALGVALHFAWGWCARNLEFRLARRFRLRGWGRRDLSEADLL